MKPCGVGCWPKDCGVVNGSGRNTANEESASSLWRTGTAGREFSRLVGRAWSEGLPDEHGGRCQQRNPGLSGERRDDLGGGGSVTSLDREIWGAACALYRLEERVQTESDSGGTDAGQNSDRKKRRSGRRWECYEPGSGNMGCRVCSIPTGRTCTNGERQRRNRCGAKFRLRSLGACARNWALGSSPPVRPRPRGGWSETTGPIRIG